MATLDLTSKSSYIPHSARHLFIPTSVRAQINELLETQHRAPKEKAEAVASRLQMVGIEPNTQDRFFVGPGDNLHGGYAKFRQHLRKLGYNVVTKG